MLRKCKRKTNRGDWSEQSMIQALNAVKGGMPYKTAITHFNVPIMSLKRRAKGQNKEAVGAVKYLGGKKPVFTPEQELELVNHIQEMEIRMYGLTRSEILSLAYQLAVKNNINHPFQKEKAGYDWPREFRRRHPEISLRAPESTSSARARAFNKVVVDKFFSTLKKVQDEKHFPPNRIYNVDETGISTVPTKNTKVFAKTGRKQVARVTSQERGETTTAVICMSAAGVFVPPMFIFKRIRMKQELMDGAPPGSVWACNPSGWMKLDVFTTWFDHFLQHVKPTADDPVLLILDGHLSHTKNLEVITKARESFVTIVCLPPHCTHKLQPLDVSVMFPLSIYHNQSLEKWMNNNNGRTVTQFQIARIFGEAYFKAAVPLNAINGFAKTGIFPLNPDVFTEVDFIAAETTNVDFNEEPDTLQIDDNIIESNTVNRPPTSCVETSPSRDDQNTPSIPSDNLHEEPLRSTSFAMNRSESPSILESTLYGHFNVTPADLIPLPKIVGKRCNLKKKRMDTSILTRTPYKNYLEEEVNRKADKENRKKEKKEMNKELNVKKTISKKKQKRKGVVKGVSNRRKKISESSSPSEDDNDTECFFCTEAFSRDNEEEGWIKCSLCQKWGHEACAGVDDDDPEYFICDFCVRSPGKKRLEF